MIKKIKTRSFLSLFPPLPSLLRISLLGKKKITKGLKLLIHDPSKWHEAWKSTKTKN